MDKVHELMSDTVRCFEAMLLLLCGQPFQVCPSVSHMGGSYSIALVVNLSPADELALQTCGADVALENLANQIGVHSGVATVSVQIA